MRCTGKTEFPTNNKTLFFFFLSTNRDPASKWFVPESEYQDDRYPLFCSGWAYVTNAAAIAAVLSGLDSSKDDETKKYFWIDDVFVTGIARPKDIPMYDWSKASLRTHDQYR